MTIGLTTPHRKYLSWAESTVGLRGKHVLEIGGCSPVQEILSLSPRSWTCVNLDSAGVERFNRDADALDASNFLAVTQDASTIRMDRKFSVVYSINSFEHISNLALTVEKIRQSLDVDGVLFTVFGPIWSADVGHHLSIPTDNGPLEMFDGVLRPWEHLTSTPRQILERLTPSFGSVVAQRVIDYVYSYPDLNRLSEREYDEILSQSGLFPVMIIKRKAGPRLPPAGASRTRELLWVLRNGRASILDRARARVGFAIGFLKSRIATA